MVTWREFQALVARLGIPLMTHDGVLRRLTPEELRVLGFGLASEVIRKFGYKVRRDPAGAMNGD